MDIKKKLEELCGCNKAAIHSNIIIMTCWRCHREKVFKVPKTYSKPYNRLRNGTTTVQNASSTNQKNKKQKANTS